MDNHIKTLISQNHLIDLLGIGLTYPIRNLPVKPKNRKVAFDETTFIEIYSSEPNTTYTLHNQDDEPFPGPPRSAVGNGKKLEIETPKITDVTHFKVLATKKTNDGQEISTYLIPARPLVVQVGLDAGIEIKLKDGTDTYPFNSQITIEIPLSQEGVLYRLTDDKKNILSDPVLGNRSVITITSIPVREDTQIIVRAVKPNNPNNPPPMSQWEDLETRLPRILILPDTGLEIKFGNPIPLDFNSATNIEISNTQKSTSYQVFTYLLDDEDYVHNRVTPVNGPDILSFKPAETPRVKVRIPSLPTNWNLPAPFRKLGSKRNGTGSKLTIAIPKQKEDILIIVLAEKKETGLRRTLEQVKMALIKPNTSLSMTPQGTPVPKGQITTIRVQSSQAGIIYQLRNNANTKNVGKAGYHHKNKGIGAARIGLDHVVGIFDTTSALMHTNKLSATTQFKVVAIKAASSVKALMDNDVSVEVNTNS